MHEHAPRRWRLRTAFVAGGLALGLSLLSAGPAIAAPTTASVSLTATPSVQVGDVVDVAVGLVGAADVYAHELTLEFDPAVFSYVADSATGPAGGFDTVEQGDGSVTLVHTRLGSSPSLAGDVAASVRLSTIGSGTASVDAATVTLIDPSGATTVLTDAATSAVAVAALPTPTPTATPDRPRRRARPRVPTCRRRRRLRPPPDRATDRSRSPASVSPACCCSPSLPSQWDSWWFAAGLQVLDDAPQPHPPHQRGRAAPGLPEE